LNRSTLCAWLLRALWQAALIVLLALYGCNLSASSDYESMGLIVYFGYTCVQDFTMLFALHRVTWINIVTIFGMHVIALGALLATNTNFGLHGFIDYGSMTHAVQDPMFWLHNVLVTLACVVPVEVVRAWQRGLRVSAVARCTTVASPPEGATKCVVQRSPISPPMLGSTARASAGLGATNPLRVAVSPQTPRSVPARTHAYAFARPARATDAGAAGGIQLACVASASSATAALPRDSNAYGQLLPSAHVGVTSMPAKI
jgi:hypothetical protein